ncbi:MAG: CDF family Co(II)/Ni(II) efflux transporter DmeF [Spirochaetaceae bacterium]
MRICNQKIEDTHNDNNMKRTGIVVIITVVTMVAEIIFGIITGSMALLADGIHMGTHTFALIITMVAYYIAKKHKDNENYPFSSGKVGVLGGYTNAIVLGITAVFMISESVHRILNPENIIFNQALFVAAFGFIVNIISALLLSSGGHDHHHGHGHEHHHDHNLRAAYIHVITDAFTSILAIVALLIGKFFNHTWPDAAVAVLGAIVILKWAYSLLISSGKLLVDYYPIKEDKEIIENIVSSSNSQLKDLHIWNISDKHKGIIISVEPNKEFDKEEFKNEIKLKCKCDHITVEVS